MNSLTTLLTAFVMVLIGLMLIGSVASETYDNTGRGTVVTDESLNVSNGYNSDSGFMNQTIMFGAWAQDGVKCGNGEGSWVSGSVAITNSSGTVLTSGNYTVNYGNNTIIFKNTSTTDPVAYGASFFGGNISLVDYRYYPSDYICSSWQRTTLNLVPGFFGLAILLAAVGLFYKVAKDEGILGQI